VGGGVEDPRSFFEERVPRALLGRLKEALPDDVVVVFRIHGPGGGAWQVAVVDGHPDVGPAREGPPDCEVRCEAAVFMAIVGGALEPRRAYLDGRVEVAGDVGLALRLQGMLRSAA
jgi:hypothetical protein